MATRMTKSVDGCLICNGGNDLDTDDPVCHDPPHNLADEPLDDLLTWFAGVITGVNLEQAERGCIDGDCT